MLCQALLRIKKTELKKNDYVLLILPREDILKDLVFCLLVDFAHILQENGMKEYLKLL